MANTLRLAWANWLNQRRSDNHKHRGNYQGRHRLDNKQKAATP